MPTKTETPYARNLPSLAQAQREQFESCLRRGMDLAGWPITRDQRRDYERLIAQLRGEK